METSPISLDPGDVDPLERCIWDETYADAPVTIERDTNTDGTRDQRLWATYDANYNVTSILTDGGKLVERYAYTPYGTRTVLNGSSNYAGTGADPDGSDWSLDSTGDSYDVKPGHQGLMWDAETGQWQNRFRYLNSSVGTFTQRDPAGFRDGFNQFAAYKSSPAKFTDPLGLQSIAAPNALQVSIAVSIMLTIKVLVDDMGFRKGLLEAARQGLLTLEEAEAAIAGHGIVSTTTILGIFTTSVTVLAVTNAQDVKGEVGAMAPGKNPGVKVTDDAGMDGLINAVKPNSTTITWPGYKGNVYELPDGTQIGDRAGSKSGGRTIDVVYPDGGRVKIHQ